MSFLRILGEALEDARSQPGQVDRWKCRRLLVLGEGEGAVYDGPTAIEYTRVVGDRGYLRALTPAAGLQPDLQIERSFELRLDGDASSKIVVGHSFWGQRFVWYLDDAADAWFRARTILLGYVDRLIAGERVAQGIEVVLKGGPAGVQIWRCRPLLVQHLEDGYVYRLETDAELTPEPEGYGSIRVVQPNRDGWCPSLHIESARFHTDGLGESRRRPVHSGAVLWGRDDEGYRFLWRIDGAAKAPIWTTYFRDLLPLDGQPDLDREANFELLGEGATQS